MLFIKPIRAILDHYLLSSISFAVLQREWGCARTEGPHPPSGRWSYLECGHGRVPVIPVYGVELGRVVELMVQLRMSFASVHHFLEGKKGRDSKNEANRNKLKRKKNSQVWRGVWRGLM